MREKGPPFGKDHEGNTVIETEEGRCPERRTLKGFLLALAEERPQELENEGDVTKSEMTMIFLP